MKNKILFLCIILLLSSTFIFAQSEDEEISDVDTVEASLYDQNKTQYAISDPNYLVTAGDIYYLSFMVGSTTVNYTIAVDSTYKIKVANLGVVDARGRKYTSVKSQIEDIVSKNYPMSGVQFTLQNPAAFMVTIKGEVKRTKEANAWALTRLSGVIGQAASSYASYRSIDITDVNGNTTTYDLYKAIYDGDLTQNPYLRPGDVITLKHYDRKVSLKGAVQRPGTYELIPEENINELVNHYGHGPLINADLSRIEITKVPVASEQKGKTLYYGAECITDNYVLDNLDTVYISNLNELLPVLFVEGAIKTKADSTNLDASNRVSLQYKKDTKYSYLIQDKKSLFSTVSDLENAYIIRGDEHIPINIEKILYDANYYYDEIIQPNDTLIVPFKQLFVSVSGSVVNPGRYPYIPDRTYDYYIGLAGGFIKNQNVGDAVNIRDSHGKSLKKSEYIQPECNIEAKTNSFNYYISQHSTLISIILSLISSSISLYAILH